MSEDIRVNHARLMQILNNEVEPQTVAEELFLRGYMAGSSGELLEVPLDACIDGLQFATAEEWAHFVIGYAKGQIILEENDEEFFVGSNEKKTLH